MDSQTLIRIATQGAELFLKAIAAANNGDRATADEFLRQARTDVDAYLTAWDAEPEPGEDPAQ